MPSLSGTNGAAVIAGRICVSASKALYVYTAATNTWVRRADLPVPSGLGVTAAIGGKVYVLTGLVTVRRHRDSTASIRRRTPGCGADAPHSHTGGVADAIGGKFYVAWGGTEDTGQNVDVYDPATNRWTTKLRMSYADATRGPRERTTVWDAAGVIYNQRLRVIGGEDFEEPVSNTIAYDPATNTWTPLANLGQARENAAAGRVRDATGRLQVLVVGGLFDPEDPDDDNVFFGESEAFTQ